MVEELTTEDLRERLGDGETPQIIDVRPARLYAEGHLPGAENVPLAELPTRVGDVGFGDDVVVNCQIGESSKQAVKLIESYEGADGAAVRSLAGGFADWEGEVETGPHPDT